MTSANAIRLLVSDVDGTLVNRDKVLTPAVLAAVANLANAGIGFTLTSARPPSGMRALAAPLNLRLPMAGFNGGLIVDADFTVLERHRLDPLIAQQAAQMIVDAGIDLWVYTEQDWVVSTDHGPRVAREAWIIASPPRVGVATHKDFSEAYKIVGVSDDPARIAAVRDRLVAHLGDTISATSSESHFIDITHARANKGAVIHALARRLDLRPSQIATIGDMPNDVLMFAQSGFSIAMGNASPAVQSQADVVTASNEADGFALAVNQHVLPRAHQRAGFGI